jgi:phosphoribosyl-ATP pyrophosphohydrolase/phosphoribosyl-AMP cyclohydrolase
MEIMGGEEFSKLVSYDAQGLVPAVVQDLNGSVLMVAYMNRASLALTIESGRTWFFSRSRQELWPKGETSGDVQLVRQLRIDCDGDCLLVVVEQLGSGACHTGAVSCFFRELDIAEIANVAND